uniref:NAD(P)/FAD-dependent oxidoreductase n=1 Tax=Cellvibrio fontiphilus TaxID=1815559 RepID=UPI002B4BFA20|nr:tryptophan 7-halogenase [Cellvibrio fontiphilus]
MKSPLDNLISGAYERTGLLGGQQRQLLDPAPVTTIPTPVAQRHSVVVIGGGPAGSVAATRLAQAGVDVVVLEREQFPRFHIGESLLPNGNRVLKAIGVWDKIAAAGFVEKRGAQFTLADRSRTVRNVFAHGWIKGLDMTYQVERARFDEILLRHAHSCGALVREQCPVTKVTRTSCGWELEANHAGQPQIIHADWVIDASGRHSVMGRALKLAKTALPYPGRMAVFNHFEHMQRDAGEKGGDVIVLRLEHAWFWAIPISATVTSVGVVLQKNGGREKNESWEQLFWRKVSESSFLSEALAEATPLGDYRIESDYSFSHETFGAERCLLAGDAASFIDPVFSSGVYLALESGLLAADQITAQVKKPGSARQEAKIYAHYTQTLKAQIGTMRQLIDAYYDNSACEVFMSPRPTLSLPQAINSVLAGSLTPGFAVRWRLWLFKQICKLQKKRQLVPAIDWCRSSNNKSAEPTK